MIRNSRAPVRSGAEPTAAQVLVKRGPHGLELRVDGTLASLHGRGAAFTGAVWWALAAPLILTRAHRRRRVLLLGLGGGSAAQVARVLDPEAELVGVELDERVIRLSRRHLDMDRLGLEVIVDDAIRHLRRERRDFDLIVEDLFVGSQRSVRKPEGVLHEGYRLLSRRLRPGGLVTSNTIHETPSVARAMRPLGGRVLSLEVRRHWNRILVAGRGLPQARDLRRLLRRHGAFEQALEQISVREWRPRLLAGAAD